MEVSPSGHVPVHNGIPQGSDLGPVPFMLFINDLLEVTETVAQMFADDITNYRRMHA